MTARDSSPQSPTGAHARLMALLAATTFAAAGSIHYQTPMLATIGAEFGVDVAAAGWVATAAFGGYLTGTIFLIPLGDVLDKRKLILVQHVLLIVGLLAMAAAPSLVTLVAASFVTGMTCSSSSQNIIPIVAERSRPEERGRMMGTLLSALFLGILFGRLAGGIVAANLGWRWMYVIAAVMLTALAPVLFLRLPSSPPKARLGYVELIGSLGHLLRTHADMRRITIVQFLLGISYGGFWGTVAAMLLQFHHLGPAAAGLMGIPGAAGILVARPAGRWMDRSGVTPVVTTGVSLVLAAFVAFGFAPYWIGAAIIGAMLLDSGLRAAMVANQTLMNSLAPDARSRSNTLFAGSVWSGNATGAFLASTAFANVGWLLVCAICVSASTLALVVARREAKHAAAHRR